MGDTSHSLEQRHLRRLSQQGPLLADLSQADVLVAAPTTDGNLEILSHTRPMNARTIYPVDLTGTTFEQGQRPLMSEAYETGEIRDGGLYLQTRHRWIRTLTVPICYDGKIIGVLSREFAPHIETMSGDNETHSFSTFRRFAAMIADGTFPFRVQTRRHDHPPRVGDGLMILGSDGRVRYTSPNALSVLTQVRGVEINIGQRLTDIGIDSPGLYQAYSNGLDYTDEIEIGSAVLSLYCIPMLSYGEVDSCLVLARNVTELRKRDRLLLSKDATIAEIHHRVKNSLQTVSSLLRLQSRRVESDDARAALDESARRIRTIGVVHELLSHRIDNDIAFGEILSQLATMLRESLTNPNEPIEIRLEADTVTLPGSITTPLALIASELIQNAIDHAKCDRIDVTLKVDNESITLAVADNGVGFDTTKAKDTTRLGMTIVRTLTETELRGNVNIANNTAEAVNPGAKVAIKFPIFAR